LIHIGNYYLYWFILSGNKWNDNEPLYRLIYDIPTRRLLDVEDVITRSIEIQSS
jgi:hypothetical protein